MQTVWSLTKSITYPSTASDLLFADRMLEDMCWTFASNSDIRRVKDIFGIPDDCTMRPIYLPTDSGDEVKAFSVSAYRNHSVLLVPALFPSTNWISVRERDRDVEQRLTLLSD